MTRPGTSVLPRRRPFSVLKVTIEVRNPGITVRPVVLKNMVRLALNGRDQILTVLIVRVSGNQLFIISR